MKILKPGEVGYGYLIERDAGYIGADLNKDLLKENFEFKTNSPIFINCILQKWGVKNKNGRIYPKEILMPQVNEYQNAVKDNTAASEADHPDSSIISLHNISHLITKMWWGEGDKENILYGKLKLLVTRGYLKYGIASVIGDKILLYLENDMKLGISSRGVGSLEEVNGENMVQDDFELIGFDLVSSPSTPGAYLFPNTETFNDNDEMSEITNYKKNSLNEDDIKKINAINKFLL
jgi:hypothetical protein